MKLKISLSAARKPKPRTFDQDLDRYLEGDSVSESWVDLMLERPKLKVPTLYRLEVFPPGTEIAVGDRLSVRKRLISVSDTKRTAKYAGLSFHSDDEDIGYEHELVLLKLSAPFCIMTYAQLLEWVEADTLHTYTRPTTSIRVQREREYLVKGPVMGTVVELVDSDYLGRRDFEHFGKLPGEKKRASKK